MSGSPTFFRRVAPAVLVGTAAVAAVALFDPALGGDSGGNGALAAGLGQSSSQGGSGGSEASGQTGGQSTTGTGQGRSNQDTNTATPTPDATSSPDSTNTASSCDTAQEVIGDSVNTRWGPVQVAALVADGQICQVYAIDAPHNDGHSARITEQVVPYLDEVATQVGTSFDSVSGATYTTEAYRDSLQSILDQM